MSSGVICVIVIPTEEEELKNKPPTIGTTLQTPTALTAPSTPTTPKTSNRSPRTIFKFQTSADQQQHINDNVNDVDGHDAPPKYDSMPRVNTAPEHHFLKNQRSIGFDNKAFENDTIPENEKKFKRNKSANDVKEFHKETKFKEDNSNNSSKKKLNGSTLNLDIPSDSTMTTVLKEILRKLKIENVSWNKIRDDRFYQITFTMLCDERYENLLIMLNEWGIGLRKGSTLSVANCTFSSYRTQATGGDDRKDSTLSGDVTIEKTSIWNRFMNNLAARLNVQQIVTNVRQDATITFDFTILVISAAILAAFGLVENSVIFLTSSMLISPLMGPIIAGIFGTVIKDGALSKLGVVNELIGLFMATAVGFAFGLIVCAIKNSYNILNDGLTDEMLSRTSLHSVSVGIITATVSGAAAAVGILGGNVGSLVGVAISASLLPPAVNAGLLWSLSCIYTTYTPDKSSKILTQTGLYSDDLASEMAILGLISMLLTISNIFCVYVVGVLILKIKEVAPIVNNKQFWAHDIKIARDYNQKNPFSDDTSLGNEFASLPADEQNYLKCLNSLNIDDLTCQNTWSPGNLHTHNDIETFLPTTVHPSRYGGGRANSICVEKLRSQLDDLNFMRRASMPFEVLTRSPKSRRSLKTLPTILASTNESTPTSTLDRPVKDREIKFTVTQVFDNRQSFSK